MDLFDLTQDNEEFDKEVIDLNWNETSGVDAPGHLQPGWAIMKSATAPNLSSVMKSVESESQVFQALSTTDLSHAPDAVQQAAGQIVTWLRQEGHGSPPAPATPSVQSLPPQAALTAEEAGLFRTLLRRFGLTGVPAQPQPPENTKTEAEQDEEELEELAGIVADEWPAFVEKIPAILNLPEAERAAAIQTAVSEFQTEIEAQYDVQQPIAKASRTFSDALRKKYAKSGISMPDGSYPIPDVNALKRAIRSYGRHPVPAVKAHIMKRARALGRTDLIPDNWKQAA